MSKNKIVLLVIILSIGLVTFANYQCHGKFDPNDLVQSNEPSALHALFCLLTGQR